MAVNGDADGGNRMTLALVAEMVRGLQSVTETEFRSIQRQLDALTSLPVQVTSLVQQYGALDRRVSLVERQFAERIEAEEERREDDRKERQAARRWLVGLAVMILCALIGASVVLLAAHP